MKRYFLLITLLVTLFSNLYAYDFEVDGVYYNKLGNNEVEITYKKAGLQWGSYSEIKIPASVKNGYTTYAVTAIGNSAFSSCTNIKGPVIIPNNITSIGNRAFANCSYLTDSLVIPEYVTSIGSSAFYRCNGITAVRSKIKEPYAVNSSTFEGVSKHAILIVPKGTKSAYKTAEGWKDFDKIVEENEAKVFVVSIKGNNDGWYYFNKTDKTPMPLDTDYYGVIENDSATIKICPNEGFRLSSFKVNGIEVISDVINNTYTIKNIKENISVDIDLERDLPQYTLTIITSGGGSVSYNGTTVRGKSNTFKVTEGTNATITLTPDEGYRVKNLIVNNTDVKASISNNQYTIKSISKNTNVEAEFEAIPPTTYTLSIEATGNGTVSYGETSVKGNTSTFTINEGTSVTITLTPDDGYRVKSLTINNTDVMSSITDNQYTISSINADTYVAAEFEAIPPTTYTLSIKATGNGTVSYGNTSVKGKTSTFTVNEGTSVTITLTPDNGYRVKSLTVNNADVTSSITDNQYTISSINADMNVEVEFEACYIKFKVDGINYILDTEKKEVEVTNSVNSYNEWIGYDGDIVVPSTVVYQGVSYDVVGIGNNAFREEEQDWNYSPWSQLNSVTISEGIKYIGSSAFSDCVVLKKVVLPSTIVSIGQYAFKECRQLESIEIPSSVKNIEDGTFYFCKGLKSVKMGDIESIGISAFGICSSLESFTIPGTTTSIGARAFADCSSLSLVESHINEPFQISENTFSNISTTAKIQVPKGTKQKYEAYVGWTKYFKEIKEKGVTTTYVLSITISGNGSATYDGTVVRSNTSSFTVDEGANVTITFTPDEGYKTKSIKVNNTEVTSSISNNQYTISSINANTSIVAEFEVIPPTTYTLSIKASGNGSVRYGDTSVRIGTKTFTVIEGTSADLIIIPDEAHLLKSFVLNNTDVTSKIVDNKYTISNVNNDITVEVEFKAIETLTYDGMEFKVSSTEQKEVVVAKGEYGLWIEVPETVSAYNLTWTVTGFEDGAFESSTGLAAVIWNPQVKFKEKVTNPNLLLYVKSADYAPTDIKNVIVNGKARSITLNDAESDNNFYCPQEFTAENITYEHNYSMKTGYSTCQGWETIVLPFDVAVVINNIGTELVPYPLWSLGESKRPFWLCSMNEDGWKDETAIKANTPYIISMPNNDNYDATYNISGNIVFSASNVTVQESNNLVSSKHGHRNLVPNFQNTDSSSNIYALNVNNLWSTNTDSDLAEGSAFIRDSRQVRPFEAYMTIDNGGGSTRSISIFDDNNTTGIMSLPLADSCNDGIIRVYSISGILLKQGSDEKVIDELPKGIYVVNGKKIIK